MKLVPLSLRLAALSACLIVGACEKGDATGSTSAAAPAPTTLRVHVYRDGDRLGALVVPPGKPAVLTLESQGGRAGELKKLVDEINAGDSFQVRMHLPKKGGERGAYGARIFKRTDNDYTEGVEMKLLDEGYDVKKAE